MMDLASLVPLIDPVIKLGTLISCVVLTWVIAECFSGLMELCYSALPDWKLVAVDSPRSCAIYDLVWQYPVDEVHVSLGSSLLYEVVLVRLVLLGDVGLSVVHLQTVRTSQLQPAACLLEPASPVSDLAFPIWQPVEASKTASVRKATSAVPPVSF